MTSMMPGGMNPLQMLMQLMQDGGGGGALPAQKRDFLESGRLRPGKVTGMPLQPPQPAVEPMPPQMGGMPPMMGAAPPMGPEGPPMMGGAPEGAGLDPEMIRMLMMGGQA